MSATGARAPAAGAVAASGGGGDPPPLPLVLCYHKVEARHELGVTRLGPRRFARQVERLARDGWRALTLADLVSCARGER